MLKSPWGDAYTSWRVLLLQTRSINKSLGTGDPSGVAIRPRRNITRSSRGRVGSELGPGADDGRPGVVVGGGCGVGAGGRCATAPCGKSVIAIASRKTMRMRWLIFDA